MRQWNALMVGLALAALTAPVAAQGLADERIQKQLDTVVNFEATNLPIEGVFSQLGSKAGIPFVVDADTLQFLPYGSQTSLDVRFKDVRLRDALTKLLAEQALTWHVDDGSVHVVPTASLYRMNRRATFDELALLSKIQTTRLESSEKGKAPLEQLREATGSSSLRLVWHVDGDQDAALRRAEFRLPGPAVDWLDMLTHGQDWTWYLSGDTLMVLPRAQQVQRQLQTRTSLRHRGAKLVDVLLELAETARVDLKMEPGVLTYLPEQTRENVNLIMADATVEQALEVISGATGLQFTTVSQGIRVTASESLKSQPTMVQAPERKRPPFFLKLSIPFGDGTAEVFYPADDLPEDVATAILKKRGDLIEAIRKDLPTAP